MKNKYMGLLIIVLVIGFAAVATSLTMNGNVDIAFNKEDLNVYFSNARENGVKNTSLIKDKTLIEFDSLLKDVGEEYVLDYEVTNGSFQYDVAIDVKVTVSDSEYLEVTNVFDSTSLLVAQNKREGKLVVKLKKAVLDEQILNIKIELVPTASSRTKIGEVVYAEIDADDAYVENAIPFFRVRVADYLDDKLISPGSKYRIKIENQDGHSNGTFYYIDAFGNSSDEDKNYHDSLTSIEYTFGYGMEENVFKVFVQTSGLYDRTVKYKVTLESPLNETVLTNEIVIPADNFCIDNGIITLSDCIVASDSMTKNLSEAKETIKSRVADYTKIEPEVVYATVKKESVNLSRKVSTAVYFNDVEPVLNQGKGRLEWDDTHSVLGYPDEYVSNSNKKWYTCFDSNALSISCDVVYTVNELTVSGSGSNKTYTITKGDSITTKVTDTASSSPGLYFANDDDGESYYYRGAVENNYVLFAGYAWRIIRKNGDGSVRMIYQGPSTESYGEQSLIPLSGRTSRTYYFNYPKDSPVYNGYKYGIDLEVADSDTIITNSYVISENDNYYFATDYECDVSTNKCNLKGESIKGKWKDNYNDVINNYKYTCFKGSLDEGCTIVSEVVDPVKEGDFFLPNKARVKYHGLIPKTLDSMWTDENDSSAKKFVDQWYEENILPKRDFNNNLYHNYLADSMFCDDREVFTNISNDTSVVLRKNLTYASNRRIYYNFSPKLTCSREVDKFNVSNGKLKYPVALITADEVAMAGGKNRSVNNFYYLNSKVQYWSMTATYFNPYYKSIGTSTIISDGKLDETIAYHGGFRPVINLRSDVKITGGNGTKDKPYEVTI